MLFQGEKLKEKKKNLMLNLISDMHIPEVKDYFSQKF